MAGGVNLKSLFTLLFAVVLSLVVCNLYLYHRNYYGPASFLIASRTVLLQEDPSATNQLIHKSLKLQGEQISWNGSIHTPIPTKNWVKPLALRVNHTGSLQVGATAASATLRLQNNPSTFNSIQPLQHNSNPTQPLLHNSNPTQPLLHNSSPNQPLQHNNTVLMPAQHNSYTHNVVVSDKHMPQHSGYMLALKIYEQQTMATHNFLQLQCFASKLNLSVVQPVMKESCFSTPLDPLQRMHMLQLEDVYDMKGWREYAESKGYAPLVKWEEFIENAPRNVVLVQMKYPTVNHVRQIRDSGKPFPHPLSEKRDYERGCGYKILDKAFAALKRKNFNVIRRVCFNFLSGDLIPLQVYQRDILGEHNHTKVTVIIDEWRGTGENQRVLVKERNICPETEHYHEHVHSSSKVNKDAQRYVERYLQNGNMGSYLAVIARFEMTALTRKRGSEKDPYAIIPFCLEETLKHIPNMRKSTGLTETFLSVDIGKYGSKSFVKHGYYGHQKDMEAFVTSVYRNKMNITDLERTFEDMTWTLDSGYLAKVQQAIVARAKCVMFVGGGTFQKHTLHLYQELHSNPSDRCIRVVEKCTSASRPISEHSSPQKA